MVNDTDILTIAGRGFAAMHLNFWGWGAKINFRGVRNRSFSRRRSWIDL